MMIIKCCDYGKEKTTNTKNKNKNQTNKNKCTHKQTTPPHPTPTNNNISPFFLVYVLTTKWPKFQFLPQSRQNNLDPPPPKKKKNKKNNPLRSRKTLSSVSKTFQNSYNPYGNQYAWDLTGYIQAFHRQLQHPYHQTHHHREFPMFHLSEFQLDLAVEVKIHSPSVCTLKKNNLYYIYLTVTVPYFGL